MGSDGAAWLSEQSDELKERLTARWSDFWQGILNTAVNRWRKRLQTCVRANGGHSEHLLWTNTCKQFAFFLAHSYTEWAICHCAACIICPSICKHLRKSLLLPGKWLDRHQTRTGWSPGSSAPRIWWRSRSRSKVVWYGHYCDFTKKQNHFFSQANGWIMTKLTPSLTSPSLFFRTPIPRWLWVCAVSSATAHIEKQFVKLFVIQYSLTFRLSVRTFYESSLHSLSRLSIRQLNLMCKCQSELFRHWWFSFMCLWFKWLQSIVSDFYCVDASWSVSLPCLTAKP